MKYCYSELRDYIDPEMMIYEEENYIYFLSEEIQRGSLLFQELDEAIVLWSDESKFTAKKQLYSKMVELLNATIIFPFVETEEDKNLLISIGAEPIEFVDEGSDEYNKEFGSYAIYYGKSYEF